ncbi:MAG: PqqD family protein [Bacteroidales bacterium]|nr:PqqD family protein [Bacteroidales bacterium]
MESRNYQLNDAKMFADITDGTAIVINSATGMYYGMNGFGTAIYENLQEGSSTGDVLSAAIQLPGIPDGFEAALEKFIASLVEFEIIVPKEETSSRPAVIDPAIAEESDFIPVCTAYQDVQELLFADPIHDVDVDEGWKPE